MIKVPVYNFETGEKKSDKSLPEAVFGLKLNPALVHQAYQAIAGNRRQVIAHTKDRAERAGSGKKPWKQKGTGNARVGSVRNPLWRKGGVVFGPTKDRNFSKNINKKMKQKAVKEVLSEKIRNGKLKLVAEYTVAEDKTKKFAESLKKMGLNRSIFVVLNPEEKKFQKISRNISGCKVEMVADINVFDLLNYDNLIMSVASADFIAKKDKKDKPVE
jgi:large subunit ribosomal protein L4